MKPKRMRATLRKARSLKQLDELAQDINSRWAGDHKGRRRVVAMLEAKRKRLRGAP